MGRWITFAIACNSISCLEQIRSLSAFIAEVSQPEEDVFSILVLIHMPDGCKNVTYQLKKGEDGKYRFLFDETVVTVESMKVQDEYVMSTINVNNEFKTTTLHGRKVTQDPEMLQKFKDECKKLGYKEDEIVVLNPTVKCQ
uniref:Lipocalin n=1 Tax=Azemiops feae TaxID=8773 RepID=I0BWR6_AZEFE|nr:lipocalin [Azemiops feae]